MLISVAIIVKNEERIIQRCLDCVSMFGDEIVVVDTGSTDKTKEIAARHPKVRLFDSVNFNHETHFSDFSFSVAKNEAVDKCRGKWVVWWDADDFASQEDADKIRRLAEESGDKKCLYTFTVKYGPLTFEHCRMFLNGIGIRFDESHSVHEYLDTIGFPNIPKREIEVQHVPGEKHVPSGERNLAIMEKDYNERGMNDPRTCFYLANTYREGKRYLEAVSMYKEYLGKSKWEEERYFARYFMAQCFFHTEEYENARKEAFRACAEDLRFAEAFCLLGDINFKEKNYSTAHHWYSLATDTPFPKDAKLFVTEPLYTSYPSAKMMECHEKMTGVALKQRPSDKKIECLVDIVQVLGTFQLPDDRDEAIMALGVLSAVARDSGKVFEIDGGGDVVSKALEIDQGLTEPGGKNVAEMLILPPNLKGRPREEWYGRAAGYVPRSWAPLVEEARQVSEKLRRALNAD